MGSGSLPSPKAFLEKRGCWSVCSGLLGLGQRAGRWTAMPPEGTAPQPPTLSGRDRFLLPRPHYRGELLGLAKGPDDCGGGREASLAPWPGLNIYYVLFGLWGRGGRAVASIWSCQPDRAGLRGEDRA